MRDFCQFFLLKSLVIPVSQLLRLFCIFLHKSNTGCLALCIFSSCELCSVSQADGGWDTLFLKWPVRPNTPFRMKMPADYIVPVDLDSVAIFVVGATPPGLEAGCLPPAPASGYACCPSSITRVTLGAIVSISGRTASFFAALGANSE